MIDSEVKLSSTNVECMVSDFITCFAALPPEWIVTSVQAATFRSAVKVAL